MNRTRLVLTGLAVAAAIAMSGCDPQPESESTATSPSAAASSAAPTGGAATTATSAAANDAATVKACADIKKDVKDNAAKITKAEKIGPPAGHIAVSAQWAAGSAAVIAHSIGANEAVTAAADKIQNEMMGLSDAYNESADAKPSKKALEAAIKELNAACSAA
ncbi:hypothetical protein [Micromonospora lupini]|uniref:Lipoprotein n=1 Tax=Micromonospora lupini str. Lupac 08 TaxID=1150864 RepID=I0L7L4_9ACTN|nr:hypothetical protein [Micromonospora lupini]CCH19811.1 conserved exported hypothetical protein [Micromonospora lupini str. Lupac 08]